MNDEKLTRFLNGFENILQVHALNTVAFKIVFFSKETADDSLEEKDYIALQVTFTSYF